MKVYVLKADLSKFQTLCLADENDWERLQEFNGVTRSANWHPLAVQVLRDLGTNNIASRGDFPLLAYHIPVFSKRAVTMLRRLLEIEGELLPLSCKEGEYYAFNVTSILDVLDETRSSVIRFSSGRVLDIKRYELFEDRINGHAIFKLKQTPLMDVFVTEDFVKAVGESGLKGFTFKLVYRSAD